MKSLVAVVVLISLLAPALAQEAPAPEPVAASGAAPVVEPPPPNQTSAAVAAFETFASKEGTLFKSIVENAIKESVVKACRLNSNGVFELDSISFSLGASFGVSGSVTSTFKLNPAFCAEVLKRRWAEGV